jgi:ABC-type multidrug transport system fused ATPase/permease subunit
MNLLLASFDLGDALLLTIEIFFFIIWIWIFVTIVVDLFRDHELGGFSKALWLLFLIIIPFFSAFIYLISRGHGMRDRAIQEQAEMVKAQNEYIKDVAGSASPADELAKLHGLLEKGAITQSEYDDAKAKIIA